MYVVWTLIGNGGVGLCYFYIEKAHGKTNEYRGKQGKMQRILSLSECGKPVMGDLLLLVIGLYRSYSTNMIYIVFVRQFGCHLDVSARFL